MSGPVAAWVELLAIERRALTEAERGALDRRLIAALYGGSVAEAQPDLGAGRGNQRTHDAGVQAGRRAELYQRLIEHAQRLFAADGAIAHQPHKRRCQEIAQALCEAFELGLQVGAESVGHGGEASPPAGSAPPRTTILSRFRRAEEARLPPPAHRRRMVMRFDLVDDHGLTVSPPDPPGPPDGMGPS